MATLDIAGFTAWSSEREPSQVFTLLESMFGVMDKAAQKFKVFKVRAFSDYPREEDLWNVSQPRRCFALNVRVSLQVETIGDCYVAATGTSYSSPRKLEVLVY